MDTMKKMQGNMKKYMTGILTEPECSEGREGCVLNTYLPFELTGVKWRGEGWSLEESVSSLKKKGNTSERISRSFIARIKKVEYKI